MRAWLFGTLMLDHNETLRVSVDNEVQAVGLMLHDLGANHKPRCAVRDLGPALRG
jgi:hypothetical protein